MPWFPRSLRALPGCPWGPSKNHLDVKPLEILGHLQLQFSVAAGWFAGVQMKSVGEPLGHVLVALKAIESSTSIRSHFGSNL